MEITYEEGTVVKRPSEQGDDGRLEREASLLVEARHAGVVTLLEYGRDDRGPRLRLEDAGGATLETILAAGSADETLPPLLASLATTIADLHDIGVVHGAIAASHVLVDPRGRPLLCSFGYGGHTDQQDADLDVGALAGLVDRVMGDRLSPELAQLVEVAHRTRRSRVSARDLAEALSREARGHRGWPGNSARVLRPRALMSASDVGSVDLRFSRPPAVVLAAAAAGGLLVAIALLVLVTGSGGTQRGAPVRAAAVGIRPARLGAPTVANGPSFAYTGGVLSYSGERFAVGEPGDQVAVGRWFCRDPELALLRPDGSIYIFDRLATAGVDVEGRLIARAPGASWLLAQPDTSAGCDVIVVGDRKGSAVFRPAAA
jgi:tRNA A-37 threonylcarbamoyl transferase component Bud32